MAISAILIFGLLCTAIWGVMVLIIGRFKATGIVLRLALIPVVVAAVIALLFLDEVAYKKRIEAHLLQILDVDYNVLNLRLANELNLVGQTVYLAHGQIDCCDKQAIDRVLNNASRLFILLPADVAGGHLGEFEVFRQCPSQFDCQYLPPLDVYISPISSDDVKQLAPLRRTERIESCSNFDTLITQAKVCVVKWPSPIGVLGVGLSAFAQGSLLSRMLPENPSWDVRPVLNLDIDYITGLCLLHSDLDIKFEGCQNV